jgi:hypothetical protein
LTRRYIAENVDVPLNIDNAKGKIELGMEYRPLQETMEDMMEQIIEGGGIQKRHDNGTIIAN